MISPLHIATDGYLCSPLSIVTNGYLCLEETEIQEPINYGGSINTKQREDVQKRILSFLKMEDEEILLIIKSFLRCQ